VTSLLAMFEAVNTHLIKSCFKTRKKGEHMEVNEIFT